MRDVVVASFWTPNYENEIMRWKSSALVHGVSRIAVKAIKPSPTLNTANGRWIWATQQKAPFLMSVLNEYKCPVAWVDADGEFKQTPVLFRGVEEDFAASIFDRANAPKVRANTPELLTGTMVFNYTKGAVALLKLWQRECEKQPLLSSQRVLHTIVKVDGPKRMSCPIASCKVLPESYCQIFDLMDHVGLPVILHHQASRRTRRR